MPKIGAHLIKRLQFPFPHLLYASKTHFEGYLRQFSFQSILHRELHFYIQAILLPLFQIRPAASLSAGTRHTPLVCHHRPVARCLPAMGLVLIKTAASGHARCKFSLQKRMVLMSLIPCTSACAYQQDGLCTLDSAAAAGTPSLGGACVHFIPAAGERLGSPHRYCGPGSVADLPGPSAYPPDGPGPHTA